MLHTSNCPADMLLLWIQAISHSALDACGCQPAEVPWLQKRSCVCSCSNTYLLGVIYGNLFLLKCVYYLH